VKRADFLVVNWKGALRVLNYVLKLTEQTGGDLMNTRVWVPEFKENAFMSFEEALAAASRDESFKATVYAMNTLLINKGVYSQKEFQALFVEWVAKELRRNSASTQRKDVNLVSA
jgi:hypothetical protein